MPLPLVFLLWCCSGCCCCSSCCCSCCPVDDKSAFTYFDRVPYTERAVGQRIEVGAQPRVFWHEDLDKSSFIKFSCWAKLARLRSLIFVHRKFTRSHPAEKDHGNSFQQFAKEAFHMLYEKKALSKSNGAAQNENVRHTPPFLEYQRNTSSREISPDERNPSRYYHQFL